MSTPVNGVLSRDEILNADDISEPIRVSVPEWGGDVYLRLLSGRLRDEFDESCYDRAGNRVVFKNARARLLVLCLVDQDKKPLFAMRDVEALSKKSGAALDRLYEIASRINHIGTGGDAGFLSSDSSAGLSEGSGSS